MFRVEAIYIGMRIKKLKINNIFLLFVKMKEFIEELDGIKYKIIVGQNDQENWRIFDTMDENDLWIHIHNKPSPHGFIQEIFEKKNIGKNVFANQEIIRKCCFYVKQYAKCNETKTEEFIYTEIKNVKKAKKIGSVIAENYVIIRV
jgi:predicted ribosome quality control (RQC) complex YloA/Tae2 family protein